MRIRPACCLLALVLAGCAHQARLRARIAEVRSIEQAHFKTQPPEDGSVLGRRLEGVYAKKLKRELEPGRLQKLDDGTLRDLFAAVRKAAFYSDGRDPALGLEIVFQELVRRKLATDKDAQELYDRLVVAGLFQKAGLLFQERPIPDRTPLPKIIEAGGMAGKDHRLYDVSEDGKTLTVERADIGRDRLIVFVTNPGCSPSRRAVELIESDPLLRCAFENHALALNPPEAILRSGEVAGWNKTHPSLRSRIAYSQADWPGIELSETPGFYFLRNGEVVFKNLGNPTPERMRSAVLEGLEAVGMTACP